MFPVLWMTLRFPIMGPTSCGNGNIYVGAVLEQILIKFPTYSPGLAALLDSVVVYNGSRLRTGCEV